MTTILLIEDEPAIRLGLEEKVAIEGYRVETATDGEGVEEQLPEHARTRTSSSST